MRNLCRSLVAPLALLILAAAAYAGPTPVGTWKGKYKVDESKIKLPPNMTDQQKTMQKQAIDQLKKLVVTIVFKSDKTYQATYTGGPKVVKTEGTWSQEGDVITTKTVKRDGKPVKGPGATSSKLKLSKDGKSLSPQKQISPGIQLSLTKS